LKKGERVLFLPKVESMDYNCPPLSILPSFWNTQMGPKWSRSLGLWCDTSHPALSEFPTSYGMQWQWNEIIENTRGINIEALPDALEPFIWPIDDWNRNFKLALAFECCVYTGKLIVCSADLKNNLDKRPVARQLLYSIMKYMDSDAFKPIVDITEQHLKSFLFDTTIMKKLNAKVKLDESNQAEIDKLILNNSKMQPCAIDNIIDGDPNTYWVAGGQYGGKYPFDIEIEVDKPIAISGISIMPRQNHRDAEGAVKRYEIYTLLDNDLWTKVACGELSASFDLKKIYFKNSIVVQKLRLKLIEGFGAENIFYWIRKNGFSSVRAPFHDECVSLAEVAFICDEDTELSYSDNIKINYKDIGTATEEIY
jgi:hypothetical protein